MFIKKEMQLNGIKNVRVKLLPELEVAIWCRSAVLFLIYKNNYNSTCGRPKLLTAWDIDSSIVLLIDSVLFLALPLRNCFQE